MNRLQVIGACAMTAGFAFVIGFGIGLNAGKNIPRQMMMGSNVRKIPGSPDDLSKCNPEHIVGGNSCFDWYEIY